MHKFDKLLVISSLVTIIPLLPILIFYPQMPAQLPLQVNADSQVSGTAPKALIMFGLLALFLLLHWACYFFYKNRQPKDPNRAFFTWLLPIISNLFMIFVIYLSLH